MAAIQEALKYFPKVSINERIEDGIENREHEEDLRNDGIELLCRFLQQLEP